MPTPPPELVDIIFSFLDAEHLQVLLGVSRSLQSLALLLLLSRYGVSRADVDSGEVCLPGEACFLIPRIHNIHPIQRLLVLPGSLPHRCLASALSEIPPIADLIILPSTLWLNAREVAALIAPLASSTDPVFWVRTFRSGWVQLRVSRPTHYEDVPWTVIVRRRHLKFSNVVFFAIYAYIVPEIFIAWLLAVCVGNLILLGICLRRRSWDLRTRIAEDLGTTLDGALRIQVLSVPGGGRIALVTSGLHARKSLDIPEFHYAPLKPAQRASLLGVLDFKDELEEVELKANCACSLDPLLAFLQRHPSLHKITLQPGALVTASPTPSASPADRLIATVSSITELCTIAEYLPHIVPALPRLEVLRITFRADVTHDVYARAVAEINSSLPLHTLELRFEPNFPRQALPWRMELNPNAGAHLHSVESVVLSDFDFSITDVERLPFWFANFPSLVRVKIGMRWLLVAGATPAALTRCIIQAIAHARVEATAAAAEKEAQSLALIAKYLHQ
ncbi:hypothetical protein DFH06DRAFT_722965 [Mycena polygramma]|nr:hypothetical protein DFH06DRAFT_722965 [Mycena polygramma]